MVAADEPSLGGAQLIDAALDGGGPLRFGCCSEARSSALDFGEHPLGMAIADRGQVVLRVEVLEAVVTDCVEHRVAARAVVDDDKRAVEQAKHGGHDRCALDPTSAAHVLESG